jgi:hypothetical protein
VFILTNAAPVVRNVGAERQMVLMRWGMPSPPRADGYPVTNIRNTSIAALAGLAEAGKPMPRSFNSFAEYAPEPNPETKKKDVVSRLTMTGRSAPSPASGPNLRAIVERNRAADPRAASGLRLPYDGAKRRR